MPVPIDSGSTQRSSSQQASLRANERRPCGHLPSHLGDVDLLREKQRVRKITLRSPLADFRQVVSPVCPRSDGNLSESLALTGWARRTRTSRSPTEDVTRRAYLAERCPPWLRTIRGSSDRSNREEIEAPTATRNNTRRNTYGRQTQIRLPKLRTARQGIAMRRQVAGNMSAGAKDPRSLLILLAPRWIVPSG